MPSPQSCSEGWRDCRILFVVGLLGGGVLLPPCRVVAGEVEQLSPPLSGPSQPKQFLVTVEGSHHSQTPNTGQNALGSLDIPHASGGSVAEESPPPSRLCELVTLSNSSKESPPPSPLFIMEEAELVTLSDSSEESPPPSEEAEHHELVTLSDRITPSLTTPETEHVIYQHLRDNGPCYEEELKKYTKRKQGCCCQVRTCLNKLEREKQIVVQGVQYFAQ